MTTTDLDYVRDRLDGDYLQATARSIARALHDRQPIAANFQPGDGTCYRIIVVPLAALSRVTPPRVVRGEEWAATPSYGCSGPGAAIVSILGDGDVGMGGAVGLDLGSGGFVGEYLASLYRTTRGSGLALELLFDAVAESFRHE